MIRGLALLGLAAAVLRPKRYALVVDTFESSSSTPVLTHSFYGPDRAGAEAVRAAHARYDAFFAQCERGRFVGSSGRGFPCRNVIRSAGRSR